MTWSTKTMTDERKTPNLSVERMVAGGACLQTRKFGGRGPRSPQRSAEEVRGVLKRQYGLANQPWPPPGKEAVVDQVN